MSTLIRNQFTTQPFLPHQWEKTEDGFLRVKARVLAERIMPYAVSELSDLPEDFVPKTPGVVMMLVDRESMCSGEALRTLESAQVVAPEHVWVTPENDHDSKGNSAGSPRIDGPYLETDLVVTAPDAIAGIESREIGEISAGYLADTIFAPGEFDGQHYDAKQTQIRFNHIAVIPYGTGRAGSDVRIINQKEGGPTMAEPKLVRVRLRNTGRYVNVDEETAQAVEAEVAASEEESAGSGKKLEELMAQVEDLNAQIAALQAEAEEGKGELSVYKEKLDELLSTEAIEHAAEEMNAETTEAEEIIENAGAVDEKGEPVEGKKKEEMMNSLRKLHGTKLHTQVLNMLGVKTEGMSADSLRGAFKAQHQVLARFANNGKKVAGVKLNNKVADVTVNQAPARTAMERLGFGKK